MLLRPRTTCAEGIALLDRLTEQGLTHVQNAVPHVTGPGLTQDGWNNLAQARRTYDEWTLEAGTELLEVFADRSVADRLRGDRYDAIMHRQFSADRHANLMHTELQELRTYFMELANELRRMQERFTRHGVRTVVLDTNDLLHYVRFDKIPWQRLFGRGTSVMIPHVVIDEIDKKSYDTHDTGVRKRARGVFALLEQTLAQIEAGGYAVVNEDTVVEVLLDEPGHVRLPNNDDEIVARARYLQQAIAPAPVTVVTGDNGMRARALSWGLKAKVLDEKYKIERLSAAEKAANEQTITFEVPADGGG
ncbi:PIN domain-containing protein [Streptomyces scabiei]|uniref:PIN domain-containing protein n=1 Tax=Streptomyces scabiei TaxID=1930 RepID=UPI00298ED653|nr:PIN domain-containing protein [Streptomyces scabiei]MDW8478356.1 PIN domain-containing protein [Streptomyces scabiei]